MDGPGDCHTDWSKSEREKQIPYINAHIWNLKRWYRWFYLQIRNTDVENKHGYQRGKEVIGWTERLGLTNVTTDTIVSIV